MIDAAGLDFTELNNRIREEKSVCRIENCLGQRFIGAGMRDKTIDICGVPGNALGAYLAGATVNVYGNAQDALGDTMNSGEIVVHGSVGDAAGYAMRGGAIYIKGSAGYRAGVHMKEYREKKPVIVIGGRAGSFLGEYQAGGLIIVLGTDIGDRPIIGDFSCTGMYGGRMLLRGTAENTVLPRQVSKRPADEKDMADAAPFIKRFCECFGFDAETMLSQTYTVITPDSKNPYKQMYVSD